jgi:hypothetical protein
MRQLKEWMQMHTEELLERWELAAIPSDFDAIEKR